MSICPVLVALCLPSDAFSALRGDPDSWDTRSPSGWVHYGSHQEEIGDRREVGVFVPCLPHCPPWSGHFFCLWPLLLSGSPLLWLQLLPDSGHSPLPCPSGHRAITVSHCSETFHTSSLLVGVINPTYTSEINPYSSFFS